MIKPMLAHKVNDKKIDFTEPVFIQPKLDGVRCVFTKDGAYSRTGKQFHNLRHIELRLAKFFDKNPFAVLDGELYNQTYTYIIWSGKKDIWISCYDNYNSENVFVLTPAKVISRYMSDYEYTDFANGEKRWNEMELYNNKNFA